MPVRFDIGKDLRYQQGVMEGLTKGKFEGQIEGRIEGKIEGQKKAAFRIAKALLLRGYDIADVSADTDIEVSVLQNLHTTQTQRIRCGTKNNG